MDFIEIFVALLEFELFFLKPFNRKRWCPKKNLLFYGAWLPSILARGFTMKNLFVSYIMGAAGLFTPLAGLHRFYLDKPLSGILYLCTWGFFGIGTIIDLIRMPKMVDDCNVRLLLTQRLNGELLTFNKRSSSPERAVLKCAQENNGLITIPMVALSSDLSMTQAKTELDRLFRENFCTKDIDQNGNEIYEFTALRAKKAIF